MPEGPPVPQAMLVFEVPPVPQAMLVPHVPLELQALEEFQIVLPFGSAVLPQTSNGDHCGNHQVLSSGSTRRPCPVEGL